MGAGERARAGERLVSLLASKKGKNAEKVVLVDQVK